MTTWLANLNGFQATTAKTNTFKLGVNNIVHVIMHYFTLIQWTQIEADSSIFAHYTSSLQDCMKIKARKNNYLFHKRIVPLNAKIVAFRITLLMDGFSHSCKLNIK